LIASGCDLYIKTNEKLLYVTVDVPTACMYWGLVINSQCVKYHTSMVSSLIWSHMFRPPKAWVSVDSAGSSEVKEEQCRNGSYNAWEV